MAILPGEPRKTWRGEEGKGETTRNQEIMCSFSEEQLNWLWDWARPSLEKGYLLAGFLDPSWRVFTIWWAFSEMEFELRRLSGEGAHVGSWGEASKSIFQTFCIRGDRELRWCFWPKSHYKFFSSFCLIFKMSASGFLFQLTVCCFPMTLISS